MGFLYIWPRPFELLDLIKELFEEAFWDVNHRNSISLVSDSLVSGCITLLLGFSYVFLLCFQALLMMQFVRSKWLLEPLVWSSWLPLERKLGCQEANLKCVSSKWTVFLQRTESRTKPWILTSGISQIFWWWFWQ